MNRNDRVATAQETLQILADGSYLSPSGKTIEIAKEQAFAVQNSIHYKRNAFDPIFAERDKILADSVKKQTKFEVTTETSLEACKRLLAFNQKIFCLNFASAKNPGGGFLGGSQAQEESLARSSGLYPCIAQMNEMYESNKKYKSCLYLDDMIYSPDVPVLRQDDGTLLETPYLVSFLTSPAVNAGVLSKNEKEKIEEVMLLRLEKLLSIAVVKRYKTLVLGAWGCGVFMNDPEKIAAYFHHQLLKNQDSAKSALFENVFERVVFAIYAPSVDNANVTPFLKLFGK